MVRGLKIAAEIKIAVAEGCPVVPLLSVYLDTNASSYLYDHAEWPATGLAAVRRAPARECEEGRIKLIVSSGPG